MSDGFAIVLGVVLLLLNAFFVGAEFSLLSSRRDRLEALLAQGKTRARVVIKASQEGSLMLTSAQLDHAMTSLRRAGSHLATATDTTGQPIDIVALEDLVEEYVGTVRDATHVE